MKRRTLLGAAAALFGAAAAGSLWRRHDRSSGHQALMRRDFTEGRIYVSDGWYLSAHEVEFLEIKRARPLSR